jgi:uncharacterized protein (TIGR02391 family)
MNIQRIAIEVGNILKWTTTINDVNRNGQAILKINKEEFPNPAITSSRHQEIYNWLCSLGNTTMLTEERAKLIIDFSLSLATGDQRADINKILEGAGIPPNILFKEQISILERADLHPEVFKHAKGSFQHEKYAHAVLEVCKAYDKAVQDKTLLSKFGRSLMQEAWAWNAAKLRATNGESESDERYHDGLKLLSEGVMTGVRNITAHEPVLDWPIKKQDCIDILHLLSFLYRTLDRAVNVSALGSHSTA